MKKNVEIEKCRFMGDSNSNLAVYTTVYGESLKIRQTDFIADLSKMQKYIQGGSKINLGSDSSRISYLIDYGINKNEPKQIIKVTIDKENLAKGDVNTIAIDSLCRNAITIKKNNIKKKVMSGVAMTLVTVGLVGTMITGLSYAAKKETEYQTTKTQEYISDINAERIKNDVGTMDTGFNIEYSNLDIIDDVGTKSR